MPKYVIERDMPGVGKLTPADLKSASKSSCDLLREMGPTIQWIQSYITDDKVYCVYFAPNEAMIREHAQRSGYPANRISRVHTVIEPSTAE